MKFYGRQLPKLCGIYSTIMDIIIKMYLLGFKYISFGVQVYLFRGLSMSLSGFKKVSFGVREGIFLTVVTRLSRPAEPSRQVC